MNSHLLPSPIPRWVVVVATFHGMSPGGVALEDADPLSRPPFVYRVENTGADFPAPVLPAFDDLPSVAPLPDPFLWSDGSGRVARFAEWSRRRAEIKAEIEHYEIGAKPARPEKITATFGGGELAVEVTVKGESLTLTARVSLPDGDGPFPAVIGIGRGTGSLPADMFESRGIARVAFNFGQVMAHTQRRGEEPINRLYPELAGGNVAKLPLDHHELMAMVAPRALLVLGNPDYTWLAEESGYVSCRAAHEVWKAFGIADRFGFSIVAGHPHCRLPDVQRPEVEAFVDKFLLGVGVEGADTEVTVSPYDHVDHARWTDWWGEDKAAFPPRNREGIETVTLEAETATLGSDWETGKDAQASNGGYVAVKAGAQSLTEAPAGSGGTIVMPFSVKAAGNYAVFARLNCPSPDDDSFWVKMDEGDFEMFNGLGTRGWSWVKLTNLPLQAGEHTLTIGYREDGAQLDKISISNDPYTPEGMGEPARNLGGSR